MSVNMMQEDAAGRYQRAEQKGPEGTLPILLLSDDRLDWRDYRDAIEVQDACNPGGVIRSLAKVMPKIYNEERAVGGSGTDWVRSHPILYLYVNKLAQLTQQGLTGYDEYRVAYEICERLSR